MDTHPNPLSDTDQRLTELEIKASYSEDLLEQLIMTIYRQQLQIDARAHPQGRPAQPARRAAAALLNALNTGRKKIGCRCGHPMGGATKSAAAR